MVIEIAGYGLTTVAIDDPALELRDSTSNISAVASVQKHTARSAFRPARFLELSAVTFRADFPTCLFYCYLIRFCFAFLIGYPAETVFLRCMNNVQRTRLPFHPYLLSNHHYRKYTLYCTTLLCFESILSEDYNVIISLLLSATSLEQQGRHGCALSTKAQVDVHNLH